MTKDAKAWIEEAIQVLDDNLNDHDALVRASGTAFGLLGNALAALSSPCGGREPLLEVKTYGYCDDDGCWVVRESPMASLLPDEKAEKPMAPLTVIIFADEEGANGA